MPAGTDAQYIIMCTLDLIDNRHSVYCFHVGRPRCFSDYVASQARLVCCNQSTSTMFRKCIQINSELTHVCSVFAIGCCTRLGLF